MKCVLILIDFLFTCAFVNPYHVSTCLIRNTLATPADTASDKDVDKPLFLTPLIRASKIREAQTFSKVQSIGNITSYSGFLTTNDKCDNNLFFWFFPAQEDWEKAPLLLWLDGGPGASDMYSVFGGNGPFNYSSEGLKMRQYSWNVKNNLLFIDNPVGTGFSFTGKECYAEDETVVGENLYSAIVQFLQLFPNLQQNKFFIAGVSYGGHYVPAIGYTIHTKNPSAKIKIDLAGMMIGNGWTDPREQSNYGDYLYQLGLIDDAERLEFYKRQKEFVHLVDNKAYEKAAKYMEHNIHKLIENYANVSIYNYLHHRLEETSKWITFLNSSSTRKSIHVGNLEFAYVESNRSKLVFNRLLSDTAQSVKPWVEVLLDSGYPMVFYVGQLDIICAYPMVINFLRSLDWSGRAQYLNATRHKWYEGSDLAGYIKTSNNIADVLVRNAGHAVSDDQPFWAYQLANRFTSGGIQGLTGGYTLDD